MIDEKIQYLIRSILEDISLNRIDSIIRRAKASRLKAEDIRKAISDYGKTVDLPPAELAQEIDAVQLRDVTPATWSIRAPLWTREEGRSDLTLELLVIREGEEVKFELDDLHVL